MKKLILFLLLSVPIFAQSTGKLVGNGAVWYDSLTTYSAGVSASDSVYVVDMNYTYSFPTITVVDSGASITDSLKLYKGRAIFYNSASVPSDTVWDSNALPVKVDDWQNDTTLAGAGMTKTYVILDPGIRLLKVLRVNAQIIEANKTDIIIEGIKQK